MSDGPAQTRVMILGHVTDIYPDISAISDGDSDTDKDPLNQKLVVVLAMQCIFAR